MKFGCWTILEWNTTLRLNYMCLWFMRAIPSLFLEWTSDSSLIIWSKSISQVVGRLDACPDHILVAPLLAIFHLPSCERKPEIISKDAKSLQPFLLWQRGFLIIYYPFNPSLTLSGFTTFLFQCGIKTTIIKNQIKCTKCFWLWPLWFWSSLWWKLSVGSHTALPLLSNEIPRTFFFFLTPERMLVSLSHPVGVSLVIYPDHRDVCLSLLNSMSLGYHFRPSRCLCIIILSSRGLVLLPSSVSDCYSASHTSLPLVFKDNMIEFVRGFTELKICIPFSSLFFWHPDS